MVTATVDGTEREIIDTTRWIAPDTFDAACRSDARTLARRAPALFFAIMVLEAVSHAGDAGAPLFLLPVAIAAMCLGLHILFRYREAWPSQPEGVLLLIWAVLLIDILVHVQTAVGNDVGDSIIMLSVGAAGIGALFMLRWLMITTLAITLMIQTWIRIDHGTTGGVAALVLPALIASFSALLFTIRRSAIRDAIRMRSMQLDLHRRDAELDTARRVHQSLATLAGGAAHHFNNRLQVITLAAEAAEIELQPDHPVRRQTGRILKAAASMAGLVADLQTYAGRQAMNRQQVTVTELLPPRLLGNWLNPLSRLNTDIQCPDLLLRVDVGQLRRTVRELLINAERSLASASGQIWLRIRLDDAGLHITVDDDGRGMHPVERQIATHPFTSGDPAARSGLGLAFAWGSIHRHGGSLTISDRAGGGTRVAILLPIGGSMNQSPRTRRAEPDNMRQTR